MSISVRLVELMGGRIWAESEVGVGTVFHFTTRCSVAEESPARPTAAPTATLEDLPVLVVDDNATNRRILYEMLSHWRMRPTLADGGIAALTELKRAARLQQPFPLLLLDAHMPEMDGFEATQAIRQQEELTGTHVPIIAMTAHAMKGDEECCLAAGMDGYVSKPVDVQKLFDVIRRVVPADDRPSLAAAFQASAA